MNAAYIVLGVVLLVAAIVDLLWTTLWVDGGSGPLSSRLTTVVWRGLKRFDGARSGVLSLAGPLMLILTLSTWVGLLWTGWTLIFVGGGSLFSAYSAIPVTWTGVTYFVAYTMFGIGNGGFYPPAGIWQLATALMSASGALFVAMGVSYVLAVLGAVSDKRSFASSVTGMGTDGEELVRVGWNGDDFAELRPPLNSLASQLDQLADQHKSYPILHYYHSERPEHASAMAVAILDEATTILRHGIPTEDQPDTVPIENVRSAIQTYVQTLGDGFVDPAETSPPEPELDRLRADDIPTVGDEEFAERLEKLDEHRRLLLGVVRADARDWPPIEREALPPESTSAESPAPADD